MTATKIRVSSRALGEREYVSVLVYDTLDEMRQAATAYNGGDNTDALGVTHARVQAGTERTVSILVRMARGHLNTQVVVHEMHHASTALYGAHVGDRVSRVAHLNHYNEPFAHLHSDLTQRLVDRLYALGYYEAAS